MERRINSIKDHRRKKLGLICFLLGIAFYIFPILSSTKFNNENIFIVKGTLRNFSFINLGRHRFDYNLFLNENSKSYQIKASLNKIFNRESFENEVFHFDSITFSCLKPSLIDLTKSIIVIEIHSKNKTYLSLKESKEILESESSNIKMISYLLMGVGFIIIIWNIINKNILNNT